MLFEQISNVIYSLLYWSKLPSSSEDANKSESDSIKVSEVVKILAFCELGSNKV